MEMEGLYHATVLALATAAIAVTTSKAVVFASFRAWVAARSSWFGELINCHYCTSHWVAFVLVAIYRPVLVSRWFVVDLIVAAFAVIALSAVFSGVILALAAPRAVIGGSRDAVDNAQGGNASRSNASQPIRSIR